ncbi:MAG: XrtA-associated ATPase [Geopsychrobacter sp.]|nr:XrtA-associated ATPase [Geopsychrobacter sp.]
MYADYFGLSERPFELVPNPRFLYLSEAHRKAISYLDYGIQERSGFILLTGEVGSGKTTLVREVIRKASADMSLSIVFNTNVDAVQLLAMINEDFGLDVVGKNKVRLLSELNDFLLAECQANRQPIIIIDEAQNLSIEALEEIRLLSNFETESFKLVQIILVGQPELKNRINKNALRQLAQRININCDIAALSRVETEEYVLHHLEIVGNRHAVCFGTGVFDQIFEFSRGVPRLINVLCDLLLVSAFAEETKLIERDLVCDAIEELSIRPADSQGFSEDDLSRQETVVPTTALPEDLNQRLNEIEANYALLNAARIEREGVLERLSGQGSILQYLINQQQKQFKRIEENLAELANKIDRIGWGGVDPHKKDRNNTIVELSDIVGRK